MSTVISTAPTLTVGLPTFGTIAGGDWRALLDIARAAEDAGVDRLTVTDHVVNGPNVADYPWGRFPTGPDADWLEPLTTLTALAAVTDRIRLATAILIAPVRPAAVLAKTASTLDVLSGGRLDLGVGTGWQEKEFEAVGRDFGQRGQLLTDTVAACRALWAPGPTTFGSSTMSFTDVYCAPQPAQARIPVSFSGTLHRANVERIVTLGDGWIPIMGTTPDEFADGVAKLRAAFDDAGRTADELGARFSPTLVRGDDGAVDLDATMADVPAMVEAGATEVNVPLQAIDRGLDDVAGSCQRLVTAFHRATGR